MILLLVCWRRFGFFDPRNSSGLSNLKIDKANVTVRLLRYTDTSVHAGISLHLPTGGVYLALGRAKRPNVQKRVGMICKNSSKVDFVVDRRHFAVINLRISKKLIIS